MKINIPKITFKDAFIIFLIVSLLIGGFITYLTISNLSSELIKEKDKVSEYEHQLKKDKINKVIKDSNLKDTKLKKEIDKLNIDINERLSENIDSIIDNADSIELYNIQSEYEYYRKHLRFPKE